MTVAVERKAFICPGREGVMQRTALLSSFKLATHSVGYQDCSVGALGGDSPGSRIVPWSISRW